MKELTIKFKIDDKADSFNASINGNFTGLSKKEVVMLLGSIEYLKHEIKEVEQ